MKWTWDPDKRAINLRRHGVKFEDVLPMLDNSLSRIEPDNRHYEDRYEAIGDVNGTIAVVGRDLRAAANRLRKRTRAHYFSAKSHA